MVDIVSYVATLLTKKQRKSLIIAMVKPVVVAYLVWKHPKISCMLGTFGHPYSNIVSKK